jgi:hypothetical protein
MKTRSQAMAEEAQNVKELQEWVTWMEQVMVSTEDLQVAMQSLKAQAATQEARQEAWANRLEEQM